MRRVSSARGALVAGFLLTFVLFLPQSPSAAAPAEPVRDSSPAGAATWTEPTVVYAEAWPDPLRFSLDDGGTTLVALIPNSGSGETNRQIVVSERVSGTWTPPVVIAENGAYSDALLQVLPQQTHPIISGDGSTIAYVGYTGSTYGAYVVDRLPGSGWSAPALVPTGLPNTHYGISLSRDGRTLALCDYPFLGVQQVYVVVRQGGSWQAPVLIGVGGNPSLSAGGTQLVYVGGGRAAYSELVGGAWTAPLAVTANDPAELIVEYPQLSGDGHSIYYWLVTLIPEGGALVRTAQDLYIVRQTGSGWGAPAKITNTPVLPSSVTDGPAAADRYATRLAYTRPVTVTDPGDGHFYVAGSHLEVSEGVTSTWQTARVVAAGGYGSYNKWPRLAADGKSLVFDGGIHYIGGQPVYNALWETTTAAAPPLAPWAFSITAVIGPEGGSLFSPFDNIGYLFRAGTFTGTVEVTHSFWPDPGGPPTGMAPIGGIGGIGGLGGAFSTLMMGPGGLPIQPLQPFTVTVDYSQTDTGTTIPGSLGLWWRHAGTWLPVPSVDTPPVEVLSATIDHVSDFAVFGRTHQVFLPAVTR